MQSQKLLFGVDHFLQLADKFSHLHFALVTNNAATTSDGTSSRIALLNKGFKLTKLFSPEHGLTAVGEDGVFQTNTTDPSTGLPVISLYGDRLMPSKEDIIDVDAILFDIPDAGCRFYTYLWTMTYIMEACAEFGKPLFILDRPNPTSGDLDLAEGPMLDETNCSSFIGRWSIPLRHSCSLGELATYFAVTRIKDLDLRVIEVQHWKREQTAKDARWSFVPPSPAIVDAETALFYPATGLFEGINVNEGRGTDEPFKIFGAPWINADQVHEEFENLKLIGVGAHPYSYQPGFGIYCNERCHGLRLIIQDASLFQPVRTGLELISLIASLYPEHCKERLYKTRANPTGEKHLDKLTGVHKSFERIKSKKIIDLSQDVGTWKEIISPYSLYQ
jgi:uncharacterized protein YbbC (DUF1343 family)